MDIRNKGDTKECCRCKIEKPFSEFSMRKTAKDGLRGECKECSRREVSNYSKTKQGLVLRIYNNQKSTSKRRGHNLPNYSRGQLFKWIKQQNNFELLYNNWVEFGYKKLMTPSVDRLDDSLPYMLNNIRLTTWYDNKKKSHLDTRSGKLDHGNNPRKPVIKIDPETGIETNYLSVSDASRLNKVNLNSISAACNGKYRKAGGYYWKFKK